MAGETTPFCCLDINSTLYLFYKSLCLHDILEAMSFIALTYLIQGHVEMAPIHWKEKKK